MAETRNALDVPAVLDRFVVAGQLLDEAAARVQALGTAAESAAEHSGALREAAQALTATARSMGELVAGLQAAHQAVREAMTVAKDFLETTDVSAVRETLQQLERRVSGLEQVTSGVTEKVARLGTDQEHRLGTIMSAVDRTAALEQERNAARQELSAVLARIPSRVAKKLGLPQT